MNNLNNFKLVNQFDAKKARVLVSYKYEVIKYSRINGYVIDHNAFGMDMLIYVLYGLEVNINTTNLVI